MLVIVQQTLCTFKVIIVCVKKGIISITKQRLVMLSVAMECLFYRKVVMMGMAIWGMDVIVSVTNNPTSSAKIPSTNNPYADWT